MIKELNKTANIRTFLKNNKAAKTANTVTESLNSFSILDWDPNLIISPTIHDSHPFTRRSSYTPSDRLYLIMVLAFPLPFKLPHTQDSNPSFFSLFSLLSGVHSSYLFLGVGLIPIPLSTRGAPKTCHVCKRKARKQLENIKNEENSISKCHWRHLQTRETKQMICKKSRALFKWQNSMLW